MPHKVPQECSGCHQEGPLGAWSLLIQADHSWVGGIQN